MGGDGEKEAVVIGEGDFWVAVLIVTNILITGTVGRKVHWAAGLYTERCWAASLDSSNPPPPTPESTVKTVCRQLPVTCLPGLKE